MIRHIITLTVNDLAVSLKNKTLFLIIFIPFFVFVSLKLVDRTDGDSKMMNIGLVKTQKFEPVVLKAMESADKLFKIHPVSHEEEGRCWLKEKKIDGLLLKSENEHMGFVLVVLKKESLMCLSMVESFAALQKAAEGKGTNWITDIQAVQEGGIQKQTLPTWILMLVLLVSFIIMPAQVAEEKEKNILVALLQTPMREIEWLVAKIVSGMILIVSSVLFLHLIGQFNPGNVISYMAFILVGSFCFSSYGVFLGFLCRNQASARTLGVIFYLPHLLPSALSDFSHKLTAIAPFMPSYPFYESIKSILLNDGSLSTLYLAWFNLLFVGLLTLFLAYRLMKKRWLM